jgi:hypothetical protein
MNTTDVERGADCGVSVAVTDICGQRLGVVPALPVKADVVQVTGLRFAGH